MSNIYIDKLVLSGIQLIISTLTCWKFCTKYKYTPSIIRLQWVHGSWSTVLDQHGLNKLTVQNASC